MGGEILRRVKKDLAGRIRKARKITFFLDCDGTLTPIRKKPNLARIQRNTKNLLKKLAENRNFEVFIISGRSLRGIRSLMGLESLFYSGNHGIELSGPGLEYVNKNALKAKPVVQKIYRALKARLKLRGIILENKIYTLSLHYRLANPAKIPFLRKILKETVKDLEESEELKVTEGKKVFEIRPAIGWDKGKIVEWVLGKRRKSLPICIGDDITDEDAFRALGKKGASILVSRKRRKTRARYRLSSPKEVIEFLRFVLQLKKRTMSTS